MKQCTKCTKYFTLASFAKKSQSPDGVGTRCTTCRVEDYKIYYAKYRKTRKQRIAVNVTRRREKLKAWVDKIKAAPCADCGVSYRPHVMDFDHVKGEKRFNISSAVACLGQSKKRIVEEIAKCELVCSNCHRERTFQRRNYRPVAQLG